jgi:hypothetical protein
MRVLGLSLALALSACAANSTLTPSDAATSLIVGERLTMTTQASGGGDGMDSLVIMTMNHADGRAMSFEEANHAPTDLIAQGADGPLAQVMGLFGGEMPTLYYPREGGAAFICGSEGPAALGVHRGADGAVLIVGLREAFQFEEREGGGYEALPFSPDMVCARLRLRRR